jgi:signal transduction histidine kinase/CHASE2 domain-containing sensor protein
MNWQSPKVKFVRSIAWRLFPGSLAALAVVGLMKLGAWRPLEHGAYNTFFRLRGEIPWDERVVIVAIDEASLRQFGRFPISRQYYTRLLQTLTQANSSVVVFNLVFSEPNPQDADFAKAISEHGRVALATAWDEYGQPLLPTPTLRTNAIALGHVLKHPDVDGITRNIIPEVKKIPSLGVAAVQAYSLVQEPVSLPDPQHPLWLNWLSSVRQAPQYSLATVLADQVPAEVFRDKIVVVGYTAAGLDPLVTPFDQNPPATGVLLNATVISNLLQEKVLTLLHPAWKVVILLLGGPGLSFALKRWSWERRLAILLVLCGAWGATSLVSFHAGYWLPIALPIMLFSSSIGILEVCERLRLNYRLQKEIKRLWLAHYQDLLIEPEPSALTGKAVTNRPVLTKVAASVREDLQPGTWQPIDQLASLAEQFARSQSTHAAIASSLPVGLLAADFNERVWFCNPLATEWLGVKVGDRLRTRLIPIWFSPIDWQTHWQMLQAGREIRCELEQEERWLEIKLKPLYYQATLTGAIEPTTPTGVLVVLEDITLHKQVELDIRNALEREQELHQLKTRFVSMVSHELRNPLTTIYSAVDLIDYYEIPQDERSELLQQIRASVQNMNQLIEDVLSLGKADAGKLNFQPIHLNLNEFCQHILAEFKLANQNRHQFMLTYHGERRDIWADAKLLRQILNNLLANAIKYSPKGGIVQLEMDYQIDCVVIRISDEGIGIPLADQERLFEAFYRATNVESIHGTGLGLAIVKRCVDLHQGHIHIASESGKGTTFTVTLPQTDLDQ